MKPYIRITTMLMLALFLTSSFVLAKTSAAMSMEMSMTGASAGGPADCKDCSDGSEGNGSHCNSICAPFFMVTLDSLPMVSPVTVDNRIASRSVGRADSPSPYPPRYSILS